MSRPAWVRNRERATKPAGSKRVVVTRHWRVGSSTKRPDKPRHADTNFIKVYPGDFAALKRGAKREYRNAMPARFQRLTNPLWTPTPAVIYVPGDLGRRDHPPAPRREALVIVDLSWGEPIGAISPQSLELEGFTTMGEFRRYWMERERWLLFEPERLAVCYRMHPFDREEAGQVLLERLYGPFLDPRDRIAGVDYDEDELS